MYDVIYSDITIVIKNEDIEPLIIELKKYMKKQVRFYSSKNMTDIEFFIKSFQYYFSDFKKVDEIRYYDELADIPEDIIEEKYEGEYGEQIYVTTEYIVFHMYADLSNNHYGMPDTDFFSLISKYCEPFSFVWYYDGEYTYEKFKNGVNSGRMLESPMKLAKGNKIPNC